EDRNVLVLRDGLHDFLALEALSNQLLYGNVLEPHLMQLAPQEPEERTRLQRLFLDLHLPDAGPVLELLRLDDIEHQDQTRRAHDARRRIVERALHFGAVIDDEQELAGVPRLERTPLFEFDR